MTSFPNEAVRRLPWRSRSRIGRAPSRLVRLVRRLAVASILIASCGAASADPLLRVYAIRGVAGILFSRGMNNLCDELVKIPQVECVVEDFHRADEIAKQAAAALAAGRRLVFVGHSMGALMSLRIAAVMNATIPLIVTIDLGTFPKPVVPLNAEVVLNYYQSFDLVGGGTLQAPPDFQGQIQQFQLTRPHVIIERSPEIHAEVIGRVKAIVDDLTLKSTPLGQTLAPSSKAGQRKR